MGTFLSDHIKKATLTKSQKTIAEYFIQNENVICNMSSQEVADAIGVSDASVIRFSRVIGFDGYAHLKARLYEALINGAGNRVSLSERLKKNRETNEDGSLDGFLAIAQRNIEATFGNNRSSEFEKAVKMILEADRRVVIGMRGCRGAALKFGRLMSFMLPGVQILMDGECTSINQLQDVTEKDMVVLFVFSRFYKIDLHYVQLARQRGAGICLITNEITGPLTRYADITIMVSSANSSFYHSTIGTEMVAEYLLNQISLKAEYRDRMDERDRVTGDQRM